MYQVGLEASMSLLAMMGVGSHCCCRGVCSGWVRVGDDMRTVHAHHLAVAWNVLGLSTAHASATV